mmetsp:Transcript_24207/g.63539  ORF Transcript_24207/g.63539 Transcript_24207/m.63539 type:complete len:407 (+) Transcript_24207:771-1991(+)
MNHLLGFLNGLHPRLQHAVNLRARVRNDKSSFTVQLDMRRIEAHVHEVRHILRFQRFDLHPGSGARFLAVSNVIWIGANASITIVFTTLNDLQLLPQSGNPTIHALVQGSLHLSLALSQHVDNLARHVDHGHHARYNLHVRLHVLCHCRHVTVVLCLGSFKVVLCWFHGTPCGREDRTNCDTFPLLELQEVLRQRCLEIFDGILLRLTLDRKELVPVLVELFHAILVKIAHNFIAEVVHLETANRMQQIVKFTLHEHPRIAKLELVPILVFLTPQFAENRLAHLFVVFFLSPTLQDAKLLPELRVRQVIRQTRLSHLKCRNNTTSDQLLEHLTPVDIHGQLSRIGLDTPDEQRVTRVQLGRQVLQLLAESLTHSGRVSLLHVQEILDHWYRGRSQDLFELVCNRVC